MCRTSRAIRCFCTLRPPCLWPSEGDNHGVSIQSSTDILLQITREWKTAKTWFLVKLFIYQSSIVSQILYFIHWVATSFSFDHTTGENRECFVWSYTEKASQYVSLTNLQSAQPSNLLRRHSWGSWRNFSPPQTSTETSTFLCGTKIGWRSR